MPGFPLMAIGAGLGQFAKQQAEQQAARERQQMLMLTLANFAQQQKDRKIQQDIASAKWDVPTTGTGISPVSTPPPVSGGFPGSGMMPQAAPPPQPMGGGGGGMRAGGGISLENMTQLASQARFSPDKAPEAAAIAMAESSGDPNAHNTKGRDDSYGLTQINALAHGPIAREALDPKRAFELMYDISKGGTDFTPWSTYTNGRYKSYLRPSGTGQGRTPPQMPPPTTSVAPMAGASDAQSPQPGDYPNAFAWRRAVEAQERGDPSGTRFAPSAVPAVTSTPGGTNGIVPAGAPAGPQTVTDAGPADDLQAQIAKIPLPTIQGQDLNAIRQQIVQAQPNADKMVWAAMLDDYLKLAGPEEKRKFDLQVREYDNRVAAVTKQWEERNRRVDRAANQANKGYTLLTDPATGKSMWVKPGEPSLPVDAPAGATKTGSTRPGTELGAELQFPEKWEGMPNKAPPGVRQDVWAATIEYVRTGKMPALGFQPGMRNMVITATPAAQHALGLTATSTPDVQAQYRGESHGMIVGGGRAAQIGFGIEEAKKAAPQVIETSKGVPRTQFPKVNEFTNWLQQQSGSPETVAFKQALNTYLNIYAATISRTGRLTDSQQNHAYELLSTAFNQGQIERGIQQLDYEMSLMREAVIPAMEGITPIGQPPAMRQPETPATPPQAATTGSYKTPDDVLRAIDSGALTPEAGKKIIIDQFGAKLK